MEVNVIVGNGDGDGDGDEAGSGDMSADNLSLCRRVSLAVGRDETTTLGRDGD